MKVDGARKNDTKETIKIEERSEIEIQERNVERVRASVRLGVRAVFYGIYSVAVWFGVAAIGRRFLADRFASAGFQAEFNALATAFLVVAASSVLGGLATFGAAAFWRRRKRVGIEEALCGIVGRTGIPATAILGVVACCGSDIERPVLLASVAGYFLTAPVALALTFPPENCVLLRIFRSTQAVDRPDF